MPTPSEPDPAALGRDIAQLETDAARLEIERAARAKVVARLARRFRYLRLARWLRSTAAAQPSQRLVMLAVGPLLVGVGVFVLLSLLFTGWSAAVVGFLVAVATGGVALAVLLYHPADALLPGQLADVQAQLELEAARLQESVSTMSRLNQRLTTLHEQRRELAKTDRLQRAMLLQRDWKSLRGSEWEDYVVEVCRTLGANVQRGAALGDAAAPGAGPRGVIRRQPTALFVTFSPRRLAVAAVSEINPFHAAAVRQILDALSNQGCDELAIITNVRLTAGSKEFARSRRCSLIGADEFPDFVLGKIGL